MPMIPEPIPLRTAIDSGADLVESIGGVDFLEDLIVSLSTSTSDDRSEQVERLRASAQAIVTHGVMRTPFRPDPTVEDARCAAHRCAWEADAIEDPSLLDAVIEALPADVRYFIELRLDQALRPHPLVIDRSDDRAWRCDCCGRHHRAGAARRVTIGGREDWSGPVEGVEFCVDCLRAIVQEADLSD